MCVFFFVFSVVFFFFFFCLYVLVFFLLVVCEYRIQPNDILHVTIQNPDNETSAFFNYGNQEGARGFGSESILYLMGFNVDKDGFISIPLIGKVKVQNLTIEECQQIIQQEANRYILNSSVDVKLGSFKVSVLG